MKVLIEIDDKDYADIMSDSERNLNHYERLIKKGVPLPKGHGDLIDREELLKQPIDKANYPSNYVRIAHTIIEADKAESEEK